MIDLVAVGHVTVDETPSGIRPGGSAYYAALTAHRLGLRVGLLTAVAPDYSLDVFPDGIEVMVVSSPHTTRYRLGDAPSRNSKAARIAGNSRKKEFKTSVSFLKVGGS